MNNDMAKAKYFDSIHLWGRVSCIATLSVMLAIPLAITLHLDAWPPVASLLRVLAAVLPLFWTVAVIESLSYGPILGSGGTYLAFVTGNIANLKMPCAIAAMKSADVRAGTEEGEVVSTIAVATSAITTTVLIAVCVLLLMPVLPFLTAEGSVLAPAFQQLLPALFGALLAGYLRKYWRIVFAPLAAGVIALVFAPSLQVGVLIPITVIASLLGGQLYWKLTQGKKKM
jgi:hypothetical protein